MRSTVIQTPAVRTAIVALGVIAVLFAVRAAADILAPFLLAIVIAVLVQSTVSWLRGRGLPTWTALVVVGGMLAVVLVGLALLIDTGLDNLSAELPRLRQAMAAQLETVEAGLASLGFPQIQAGARLQQAANASGSIATSLLEEIGSIASSVLLVVFYVLFLLLESTVLPSKLETAFGAASPVSERLGRILASVQSYLVVQTALSALVGALVTVTLWLIGVDYALLWGVLAFLLNYVPNFGPILAAIPAVVMAFIQFGPGTQVLLTILAYVAIFIVVGSLLYPRVMGSRVGLSPLVVLVAMILWGWLLGPVGLILSVPLVAAVKIVADAYAPARWLAILLGNA
ncbi:MAG: AI-2E family transporter [Caldilinea sp.]|nr:AI-2E family transporter [Caldilinea sp.]MCB9116588.1 AI-2E family transporter [Caldilineaceae bacterium]MCB9118117.1 AI-2E family transporter [Caldilineaceae bacterium]MCB9123287.1 AI-2E family transporter [Caldilineaceae bacterium]MCO5208280.1 AI-2E family transporter [Caldilinea sp.]